MHGSVTNFRFVFRIIWLTLDSIMYLLTGGDDNAVDLTQVEVTDEGIICTPLAEVLDAHTSTVTGVLFLGDSRYLSIGIDQNIRIWRVEERRLSCIYEGYTFVPDVCGITEISVKGTKRRFVVFGTGLEMLEFEHV